MSGEANRALKTGGTNFAFELRDVAIPALRTARQNEYRISQLALPLQFVCRRNNDALTFDRRHACRMQHNALLRRDTPLFAQRRDARGRNFGSIKTVAINTAIYDANAVITNFVSAPDKFGRVIRVGDRDVGPRHDAVVQVLDPRFFAVGAVVGCHKWDGAVTRCHQRTPSRGAASGVNEVDALVADDPGYFLGIPQNARRVFGGGWKRDKLAANLSEARYQTATCGKHYGPATSFDNGFGDFDRRKFSSACVEMRNDLQYGWCWHVPVSKLNSGFYTVQAIEPQLKTKTLAVGEGAQTREIAYSHVPPPNPGATSLFWLSGFMSDMASTKATAVAAYAKSKGLGSTLFDYSGHGVSSGKFIDGTMGRWLEEAVAIFTNVSSGPQIIIGSSMGGHIALVLIRKLQREAPDHAKRIKGLILIAPAWDMTEELMWKKFPEDARRALIDDGVYFEPSNYGEPYTITRGLIDDGRQHLLARQPFDPGCPVRILQGLQDVDVPASHTRELLTFLKGHDIRLVEIADGEHRLSRAQDLEKLYAAISELA